MSATYLIDVIVKIPLKIEGDTKQDAIAIAQNNAVWNLRNTEGLAGQIQVVKVNVGATMYDDAEFNPCECNPRQRELWDPYYWQKRECTDCREVYEAYQQSEAEAQSCPECESSETRLLESR